MFNLMKIQTHTALLDCKFQVSVLTSNDYLDLTLETLIVKQCDKFLKRSQLSFIALNNDEKITCELLKSLSWCCWCTLLLGEVLVSLEPQKIGGINGGEFSLSNCRKSCVLKHVVHHWRHEHWYFFRCQGRDKTDLIDRVPI